MDRKKKFRISCIQKTQKQNIVKSYSSGGNWLETGASNLFWCLAEFAATLQKLRLFPAVVRWSSYSFDFIRHSDHVVVDTN